MNEIPAFVILVNPSIIVYVLLLFKFMVVMIRNSKDLTNLTLFRQSTFKNHIYLPYMNSNINYGLICTASLFCSRVMFNSPKIKIMYPLIL